MSSYEVIFQFARARHHWSMDRTENVWAKQFRSRDVRAGKSLHLKNAASRDRKERQKKEKKKEFYPRARMAAEELS